MTRFSARVPRPWEVDPSTHSRLLKNIVFELARRPVEPAISTGFKSLDAALHGGWREKRLYGVGGFAASGKTTTLGHFIVAAVRQSRRVQLFTLDQPSDDAAPRLAGQLVDADVPSGIESASEPREEFVQRIESLFALRAGGAEGAIAINDESRTLKEIEDEVGKVKPDLVAVDFAQLVRAIDVGHSSEHEIALAARGLRDLAKAHGIPVLAAIQTNRSGLEREVPGLEHLRGSGELEQAAHAVLTLRRDGSLLTLALQKNRGPLATAYARIDVQSGVLSDVTERIREERLEVRIVEAVEKHPGLTPGKLSAFVKVDGGRLSKAEIEEIASRSAVLEVDSDGTVRLKEGKKSDGAA